MKQLELFEPASILQSKEYLTLDKHYPWIAEQLFRYYCIANFHEGDLVVRYLNSLLVETRNGTRKGFPPEHASCILNLIELRKKLKNDEFKET